MEIVIKKLVVVFLRVYKDNKEKIMNKKQDQIIHEMAIGIVVALDDNRFNGKFSSQFLMSLEPIIEMVSKPYLKKLAESALKSQQERLVGEIEKLDISIGKKSTDEVLITIGSVLEIIKKTYGQKPL